MISAVLPKSKSYHGWFSTSVNEYVPTGTPVVSNCCKYCALSLAFVLPSIAFEALGSIAKFCPSKL